MSAHRLTWLDVFAERPLTGNQLAVVHDADGLGEETMLAFARETKLAETTFVQTADAAGADYRNRIFTVAEEMPFAGHPSLGTAVAVALARGERAAEYVQQTPAGLQAVRVAVEEGGRRAQASVLQNPAGLGPTVDAARVLPAVGLGPERADRALPPQVVDTGLSHLLAPIADATALATARPDLAAIADLLTPLGAHSVYLVACDPAAGRARARMFTRLTAEGEDAATGSAAGPLVAYLATRAGCERVEISQGVEMGRPSRLHAAMEDGRPRVGGGVVVVAEGTVHLPRAP